MRRAPKQLGESTAVVAVLALLWTLGCADDEARRTPVHELRQGRARVLTERHFAGDAELRLRTSDTAVFRLEGGEHPHPDTGTRGVDLVPIRFEHPARHSFCVGDGDGQPESVAVLDEAGAELGRVARGTCETFALGAGDHVLRLQSGDALDGGKLAFVRPVHDAERPLLGHGAPALLEAGLGATGYTVPSSYDDIPYRCTMNGPWQTEELLCEREYCPTWERMTCEERNAGLCDTVVGDPGHMADAWRTCFQGSGYTAATHDPIMLQAARRWRDQWCQDLVPGDCATEWWRSPDNHPTCAGFEALVPYASLALAPGQVAVIPQSLFTLGRTACPPSPDTLVAVLDGSCDDLRHRVGGVVLGPRTQAVLYSGTAFAGFPVFFDNLGETPATSCLPMGTFNANDPTATTPALMAVKRSRAPSVAVNQATGTAADPCRAERVGLWCQAAGSPADAAAVYRAHPEVNLAPPGPGEILLVGRQDLPAAGTVCGQALVLNSSCDDLSRLGFEDKVHGLVRPSSDTFATVYFDRNFAGKHTTVDEFYAYPGADDPSRGQFQLLPDPADGGHAGRGTVSSVRPMRTAAYNHTTLITTGSCGECNLAGVDLSAEDLTDHVLVGADLAGARLVDAILTGADLGHANLVGADLSGATFGGTRLGCADLAGMDTRLPSDPHHSSLRVLAGATWERDFTVAGTRYLCDVTHLAGARLPITLLPRDSWVELDLSNVTLLDLADGYALDGLVLSGGSFPGLVAGQKALSIRGVQAQNANLAGAVLTRVDFGERDVAGVRTPSSFAGAILTGAALSGTNLEGADLSGAAIGPRWTSSGDRPASLAHAYLRNANLSSARLTGADLTGAYFYGRAASVAGATLQGASLANGVFAEVDFRQCKLAHASFAGAQLINARFDDPATDVAHAVFTDAHLQGASFAGAALAGASFERAWVSTAAGCWGYADLACQEDRVTFGATDLGATDESNRCPNGDVGPCTGEKLEADGATTAPVPDCVPDLFGADDACMSYEILRTGELPACTDTDDELMQCGCLEPVSCGS